MLAGACTSMNMHIPRGTSLTWRISDPHHPTQGEGVSPQVECTHVVRLCRLRRALGITPGLALFDYLSFLTSRHRSGPSTSTRSEFLRMREPPQASEDRRRHASATLRGCCGAVERASAARAFEGECQTWGRFLLHHGEHDLFFFASSTSSSCAEEAQVWGAFGRQRHVAVLLGNGPDHAAVGSGVGPFRRPSRRSIPGPGVEQGPAAVESVVEI